jgi:hypothetical protein
MYPIIPYDDRPVEVSWSAYHQGMQDCYAFDVGDFGKLGLLRHLHRVTGLRLGVLWWRTALGTTGSDGKHVDYLQDPAFQACDSQLWEEMRRRFDPDARTIAGLQPLLPPGTLFNDTPVPPTRYRAAWLKQAVSNVQGSALVFCDPDNGLTFNEPCRSLRHVSVSEIRSLYNYGYSLVVYHTPGRATPHDTQIAAALERLRQAIPGLGTSWAARFTRGSSRVFFVLAQPTHAAALDEAMIQMLSATWVRHGHFELVRSDNDVDPPSKSSNIYDRIGQLATQPVQSHPVLPPGPVDAVRVVLNDNGGLNLAANPWLARVECPCRLRSRGLAFSVVAPFNGRSDMYRLSPSALTLARALSFSGPHLSALSPVVFDATVIYDQNTTA